MANRHPDFEYILGEFKRYYKDQAKAMNEYQAWLNALKLNDSKSYGQSRESFQWAKDMISRFKEDAANVYYKVLVGFPTKSMNRNVYKERDLVAAAHTLVGKHPSINHKDDYWLSPENPHNRWGVVTVVAAAPEDGAVEAILQVPKTATCPVCNGGKITDLIDQKRIYNVSLEGHCNGADSQGACDGFEFDTNGFSLLTTDVLPGIPMTKIYPIESFLAFLPSKPSGKRAPIKIVGLKTEGELSGMANPDTTVKVVQPDSKGQCPAGMMWSARVGGCVEIEDGTASTGFDTRPGGNKANSDLRKPRAETDRVQFKPEGTKVPLGKEAGPDNSDVANRAMGNPKGCEVSDVGIQTPQMPGGSDVPKGSADQLNAKEASLGGLPPVSTGAPHVLKKSGSQQDLLDDNSDQWLIENDFNPTGVCRKGEVYDARIGRCVRVEDASVDKMGKPGEAPNDQPTGKDGCPAGMTMKNGRCVYPDDAGSGQGGFPGKEFDQSLPGVPSDQPSSGTAQDPIPDASNDQPTGDLQCPSGMVMKDGRCTFPDDSSGSTGPSTGTPGSEVPMGMPKGEGSAGSAAPQKGTPQQDCPDGMIMGKDGICHPAAEARLGGLPPVSTGAPKTTTGDDKWHPDNDNIWLIEQERRRLEEPFAGYKNWADCMAKNGQNAKICGSIKAKTEARTMNHELELSQALSKAAALEAQMSQEHIQHDAEVKGLKALVAQHWEAYQVEKDKRLQFEGRLKQQADQLETHEDRTRTANNERVELETKLSRRERDLAEALENASKFKKLYEDNQAELTKTEGKYRESLTLNMALNKQITKNNEDYLKLAREKEAVEEELKHAKRMASHIFKVKPKF